MTKMKFKRSAMALAVAGAVGIAAPAVQAVNLADDGLGEVLLFPYYGVLNGYDTYLNITNASADTVAVKLRFREAHNSRDVRDFNIILSPWDVWVGAVTLSPDGTVARVQTTDKTCTQPQLPVIDAAAGLRGIDFTNFDYTQSNADGGPTGLDRTKEGHVEVIEMGVSPAGNENVGPQANPQKDSTIAYKAKHVNGVPRDCAGVVTAFETKLGDIRAEFNEPKNNLKGTGTLIKVDAGKAGAYEAVTLANFYNPVTAGGFPDDTGANDLIFQARDSQPNLGDVFPAISVVQLDSGPGAGVNGVAVDSWAVPVDAVSAVLTRQSLANQFNVQDGLNAETDMVVTFPTKYFYVDSRQSGIPLAGPARAPFAQVFQKDVDKDGKPDATGGKSCDQVVLAVHDREEFTPELTSDFSPPPPSGRNELCNEVNVLTFNGTNALGSAVSQNIVLNSIENGWLDVGLEANEGGSGPTHMVPSLATSNRGSALFYGLPVIGMSYTTLENGVAGDNTLNYGSMWNHAYRRNVSTSAQ